MDINMLFEKLKTFESVMQLNAPCSVDDIEQFQKENGILLPESLISLFRFFDGGELFIPGTIVYGISMVGGQNLKSVNGKDRRKLFSIPKTYLIFGKLNYGDYICINLNRNYEVIQWDHELDEEFCRWSCLESWLEETIDNYEP